MDENQETNNLNISKKEREDMVLPPAKTLDLYQPLDMRMVDDRVVIEQEPIPEKTTSGIYIPEVAGDEFRPRKGYIVAIGAGHIDNPIGDKIRVGDRVLFTKYAGSELKYSPNDELEEKEYLTMKASDILSVIPPYQPKDAKYANITDTLK